ncbi:C-C chemokine receptor type 10 [Clinocottus analis]|uniref:C-C chemokine receptor type 10 n=1 Tax=Clinocottus analis TaxID=304258 RepID=UPI0035C079D2
MQNTSNSSAMHFSLQDDVGYADYESFDLSDYAWSNSSNTSNATDFDSWDSDFCEAGEQELAIQVFQVCVFSLIFLLGVAGNGLVIATFALYRRLRLRSVTDVFLFHLALADLLLLLTLPLQAADTLGAASSSGALYRAARACHSVNTYSGLLLLACVSVDRYVVVARAQQVLRLRARILAGGKAAAVAVWVVAVLLSLPELLYSGAAWHESGAYCGAVRCERLKTATNAAAIAVFCASLAVMVACYSLVARVLWAGDALRRGKLWHRQRTLKLMVALVLVFLAFQLPHTVVLSRKMAGPFCGLLLEYVTCTLAYFRCCLNPVLYALVGVRFRHDVLRLVRDSGCGRRLAAQSLSTNSISISSPAPGLPHVTGGRAGSSFSPRIGGPMCPWKDS